jgi:hypothetical protein
MPGSFFSLVLGVIYLFIHSSQWLWMKKLVGILYDSCGQCYLGPWGIFSGLPQRGGLNKNNEGQWVSK